jgi:hypothetical protein
MDADLAAATDAYRAAHAHRRHLEAEAARLHRLWNEADIELIEARTEEAAAAHGLLSLAGDE